MSRSTDMELALLGQVVVSFGRPDFASISRARSVGQRPTVQKPVYNLLV